jgi:Glycosyl transferase family 2
MKTVITHMYNEEYLLPWWLHHHKNIFDYGVIIDYGSTDRSVEICKEICPNWKVVTSENTYFNASKCDQEIMGYERQLQGWRIALTVTEFLVGDTDKLMTATTENCQYLIPGIRFTKWNPRGKLNRSKPLWEQVHTGISYYDNPIAHQARSLHNFNDIEYTTGRHYWPPNTEDVLIFHYAHCIVGKEMLHRRLQIQNKVSPSDIEKGIGNHHYVDKNGLSFNELYRMHTEFIAAGETDCTNFIDRIFKGK